MALALAALPLLNLHGLSTGDFVPAFGQFLGSGGGLSGPSDHEADRDLAGGAAHVRRPRPVAVDYVYRRDPREHPGKLRLAVMIGVRADGRKELRSRTSPPRLAPGPFAAWIKDYNTCRQSALGILSPVAHEHALAAGKAA